MAAPQIVVAFRMGPAGLAPGGQGTYLQRVRSLRSRGEALGGKLIAWNGASFAMAWESDSIEEAVLLATTGLAPSVSIEHAWSSGVAEGELEPLACDGQTSHLASGWALLSATSLARVANPGEVLVDDDVRALREGQLSLLGSRASSDAGRRVRGWRLDLNRPWKWGHYGAPQPKDDDAESTRELVALNFPSDEFSTGDVLEIIEASAGSVAPEHLSSQQAQGRGALAERIRRLSQGDGGAAAVETLAELRRARARAEGGSAAMRCQAAVALAMALFIAGRPEDALLEALDALARAHEADAPKARAACMALLSKLYAAVGMAEVAGLLQETLAPRVIA